MALTIADEALENIQVSPENREKALQKAFIGVCYGFIGDRRN